MNMNLLWRDRVLGEELGEDVDHLSAVEDALGAEVAARSGRRLEHEDVGHRHVLDVDVSLDGVGIGLGRASQVLENVNYASVHRRLEQRAKHQHRVHRHQIHAFLLRHVPRRLLRHRLPVAVPVLPSFQQFRLLELS